MARFIKMHVFIGCLVLLASCCCSINASNVEEQLLQLQDSFNEMRGSLAEKSSRMDALELQVAQLTSQVIQLERVENQNKILMEEIAQLNEMRNTRVLNGISNQPSTNAISQMPTSCEDLSEIGHTLNGLYSVMGMKSVESVYCDFSNATNDSGFQTWIGHVDVKSTPTYFFVRRSDYFEELGTPILFDIEELNVGAAYDKNSGIFTAPVTGKYFFTVSGLGYFPGSIVSSRYHIQVGLYKNDEAMAFALADEVEVGFQYETFSLQLTLELTKGDQISVRIQGLSPYVSLRAGMFTQFNGFLLEEDITQFLHML